MLAAKRNSIARVKNIFLKGLLGVYIIAFVSLYIQVKALFGDEGIVPIKDYVKNSQKNNLDTLNLILYAPKLGLDYGTFLELICLVSTLVAATGLLSKRLANSFTFGLLWYVYYSIYQLGQGFMAFESDCMLIEVGFIAIFLAPLLPSYYVADHDHLTWFLIRWSVFRWAVTTYSIRYYEGEEPFIKLEAAPMMANAAPFPSPHDYWLHSWNRAFLAVDQIGEHTFKLAAAFLMAIDFKYTRLFAFWTLIWVDTHDMLFFNDGFSYLLVYVSLISFLKDSYFYSDKKAKQSTLKTVIDILFMLTYIAVISYSLVHWYGFAYVSNKLVWKPKVTAVLFRKWLKYLIPASLAYGTFDFVCSLYRTYFASPRRTPLIKSLLYTIIVATLFVASFPALSRYDEASEQKIKQVGIKDFSRHAAPFIPALAYKNTAQYTPFFKDGRPELTVESRASPTAKGWDLVDMRYKIGKDKPLVFVLPHVARLEYKFWLAIRSPIENNQWMKTFLYRVATKQPDVLKLLAPYNYIEKAHELRVAVYNYKMTDRNTKPFTGYWAERKYLKDYLPPTPLEALRQSVKDNGITVTPTKKTTEKPDSLIKLLSFYLEAISDYIRNVNHTAVVWTVMCIVVVSVFRKS